MGSGVVERHDARLHATDVGGFALRARRTTAGD